MKKKLIVLCTVLCVLGAGFFLLHEKPKDEITIVSGGDLLISESVLEASTDENGNYSFDDIFREADDYIVEADCAMINLETSIGGDIVEYQGFPRFNTPESVLDAAKAAGFDVFLTASNHSYDLGYDGMINRLNELEERDLQYVGTRKDGADKLHKVIDVDGFKIGVLNYTKETAASTKDQILLNVILGSEPGKYSDMIEVEEKAEDLIARFNYDYLDEFYDVMEEDIDGLYQDGAEIIVAYPHWGSEYYIEPREEDRAIAQKMCDLGVDIIVGGHPHVVQPTEVLKSEISGKETICLYSMGNFVSSMNRNQGKRNGDYVEDGALFSFTIKRNDDGIAEVASADVLPLWVQNEDGKYVVIPLDPENKVEGWGEDHENSYQRTMGLVGEGLEAFRTVE